MGQTAASATDAPGPIVAGYGLCIRSVVPLPGAVPVPAPTPDRSRAPDVEIVHATTPAWQATRAWGVYRVESADRFEIAIPSVARFTCLERSRILVDPMAGADRSHIADMLIATVLPALLWARGDIVLHAAAFRLPGAAQAIAVAGASGSGKSTALARALAIGARQVADDSVCIRARGDTLVVSGLAGGYFERGGDVDDRVFRPVPPGDQDLPCRLGALVVLSPDAAPPQRLSGPAAIAALLRHRHRPRIAALLRTEPALLPGIATIARTVPVVAVGTGHGVAL